MSNGYKKYMKKDVKSGKPFLQIFLVSFFSMLLVCTFIIKSFSPTVDTSIGDYQDQEYYEHDDIKKVDNSRLEMIQQEDQGRNFSDLVSKPEDVKQETVFTESVAERVENKTDSDKSVQPSAQTNNTQSDPVYKVFIGTYTSAEQAKVAKDIIQESGNGLNPIVKCLGSSNYTLQVGIFKNKQSAESLLYTVQQNHLPGRVVQD